MKAPGVAMAGGGPTTQKDLKWGQRAPVASSLLLERGLGDFSLETLDGPQAKVQA